MRNLERRGLTRALMVSLAVVMIMTLISNQPNSEVYADTAKGSVIAENYTMDITLDTKTNSLQEVVTVKVKNNTENSLDKIVFRNFAASAIKDDIKNDRINRKINKNKSSKITEITRTMGTTQTPVDYKVQEDESVIYANLGDNQLKPGETATLTIKCDTGIPKINDRFGYKVSKAGKIYSLSFCFPQLSMYKDGKWNENPYYANGESRSSACTNYNVTFHGPKDYMVVASGDENTNDGVTTIEAKDMRDMAIVACNYMKLDTAKVDGIDVNNYYLKGNKSKVYRNMSMAAAKDAISIFNEKFGSYPYTELDIVQGFVGGEGGGMEYPGLVLIDGSSYSSGHYDTNSAFQLCVTVAHETGHEWFYSTVGNDEYTEAWLDEGFATYCDTVLYETSGMKSVKDVYKSMGVTWKEKKNGRAAYDKGMESIYKENMANKKFYVNKPINKFANDNQYGERVYTYGQIFIWKLETTMGSEKFDKAVKEYYSTFSLKEATTADFLQIIRKYDNSEEINKVIDKFISAKYLAA